MSPSAKRTVSAVGATVYVQHHPRGHWEVVMPDGQRPVPCATFDEARRIAYGAFAHAHECELIIRKAHNRLVEPELTDANRPGALAAPSPDQSDDPPTKFVSPGALVSWDSSSTSRSRRWAWFRARIAPRTRTEPRPGVGRRVLAVALRHLRDAVIWDDPDTADGRRARTAPRSHAWRSPAGPGAVSPAGVQLGHHPPGALAVERGLVDGTLVLALAGDLDIATRDLLRRSLGELDENPPARLVVDLRGLVFIDVSGLSLLLSLANRCRARGPALDSCQPRRRCTRPSKSRA